MLSETAVARLLKLARTRGMCCGPLVAFLRYRGIEVTILKAMSRSEYEQAMALLRARAEV